MTITSANLVVTSCGKVICSTCKPRLSTLTCRQCRGPCSRSVPLSDKAPKEVLNLFTDISEQLKAVFKNYNFQESQKRSLLEFKDKKSQQMRKVGGEMIERKKADMDKLAYMKEQMTCLERKEAELRNNLNRMTSPAPRANMAILQNQRREQCIETFGGGVNNNNNRGGALFGGVQVLGPSHNQDVFGQQFGEGGSRKMYFPGRSGGRSGGSQNSSRERIHGSSPAQAGFFEMKTPAVWYHKQKDRVARSSPQQTLMELGAVKRSDGENRCGSTLFFTSPPNRMRCDCEASGLKVSGLFVF